MSLFEELSQTKLIESPKDTIEYRRILKQKKEKKVKSRKDDREEMRKKLSEKEFKKRQRRKYYEDNKKFVAKQYQDKKKEKEAYIEEIYKEIYDPLPEPIDYDKFYTEKFKDDDTVTDGYRFYWRSSRLKRIDRRKLGKQVKPFRISERAGLTSVMSRLGNNQLLAYKYLAPHLEEIKNCRINLQKRQQPYKYPMRSVEEPLNTLSENADVNKGHIITVADAMIRGKYIPEEIYLGRNNFIFGDVLVTQTGNLFRISLENNLKWLTPDTVETIHEQRMKWRKEKAKKFPPILLVNDAYLIKIPINERENLFYIVPT